MKLSFSRSPTVLKTLSTMRSVLVLLSLFLLATAASAEQYQVSQVTIEGNQRIDGEAIKLQLKKTSGTISTEEVSEDVKALYKTGFFDQVSASYVPGVRPTLKYIVVEKPVVRKVFIKGNKEVEEKDLSPILTFDARRFLDKAKVDGIMKQAVAYYQAHGFYDATIDFSVIPAGENQVDVTFNVEEGTRYKIREINFNGLQELDDGDLRSAIMTRRYKWYSSWATGTGRLSKDQLANDRIMLRQYFLDHGLLDATVSDAQIEKKEDGLYISFDVSEGPVYTVGEVTASGDLLEAGVEETLKDIKTEPGETFSATEIREDSFRITDKFSDTGYAFANVVPNTTLDRNAHIVNLEFNINKGQLVQINRINIKGNDKTYDRVIRRELKVDEQERYNGSKVKRSQDLLQRLGYFEEVNISSEPVDQDKVDLNVNVREGNTGTLSAGAGFSSSDGVVFNARVSENNLFGTGRRAVVNADVGSKRDSIVLSFEDRRLNDSHVSGGIDLLRTDREYSDFDRRLMGGSLNFGYPMEEAVGEWAEDISAGLKYELLDIDIRDVDEEDAAQLVIDSEGRSLASGVTPRLVRSTINNPLNPVKGSRQEVSVELTGLGGDEKFYLLEGKNTLYYPLLESSYGDLVFSWRTTVGYGESYDNDPLPLYRRYFPGGINSVRGYKNRSLGPKDDNGNEFGGSKELVNNFEILFPLINAAGIKGLFFYDAGEAFDDNKSIDIGELRLAYGFGVRWSSPLGPIRLEFGFPIGREEGEDNMQTMFSFGAPL